MHVVQFLDLQWLTPNLTVRHEAGTKNFANIMVSYVPTIHGEQKTKPTQHAVKTIRSAGLIPDVVRSPISLIEVTC